jgi:hypothetical protein
MHEQTSKPFGKLFAHTWTGSMAWQPPVVYAVWSYAIANAKPPHGHVEINVQTISRAFIKDSVENIQSAVDYLCSPDPDSRNKTEDGRRMIHLGAFDYQIVNWAYYRNARFLDEKHANDAERQRKHRNKLKNQGADSVTPNVTRHIERHSLSQCVAPTEAEAEAEADSSSSMYPGGTDIPIVSSKGEESEKGKPPPVGVGGGDSPDKVPETTKPKTKTKPKAVPEKPPHDRRAISDAWVLRFKQHTGSDYAFNGARDGKAISDLLALFPAHKIIETIHAAFDTASQNHQGAFWLKKLNSLSMLASRYNEFVTETAELSRTNRPVARNVSLNTSPAAQQTARELIEEYERTKPKL